MKENALLMVQWQIQYHSSWWYCIASSGIRNQDHHLLARVIQYSSWGSSLTFWRLRAHHVHPTIMRIFMLLETGATVDWVRPMPKAGWRVNMIYVLYLKCGIRWLLNLGLFIQSECDMIRITATFLIMSGQHPRPTCCFLVDLVEFYVAW